MTTWVLILTILSFDGHSVVQTIEGFDSKINCDLIGNQWANSFENIPSSNQWRKESGIRLSYVCAPVKGEN